MSSKNICEEVHGIKYLWPFIESKIQDPLIEWAIFKNPIRKWQMNWQKILVQSFRSWQIRSHIYTDTQTHVNARTATDINRHSIFFFFSCLWRTRMSLDDDDDVKVAALYEVWMSIKVERVWEWRDIERKRKDVGVELLKLTIGRVISKYPSQNWRLVFLHTLLQPPGLNVWRNIWIFFKVFLHLRLHLRFSSLIFYQYLNFIQLFLQVFTIMFYYLFQIFNHNVQVQGTKF